MKKNEKITTWNRLTGKEKRGMGDHYITHCSNLNAWNKDFKDLSPLKQKRVLQSIENFVKLDDHRIIS
jgi:hypothetical protein